MAKSLTSPCLWRYIPCCGMDIVLRRSRHSETHLHGIVHTSVDRLVRACTRFAIHFDGHMENSSWAWAFHSVWTVLVDGVPLRDRLSRRHTGCIRSALLRAGGVGSRGFRTRSESIWLLCRRNSVTSCMSNSGKEEVNLPVKTTPQGHYNIKPFVRQSSHESELSKPRRPSESESVMPYDRKTHAQV